MAIKEIATLILSAVFLHSPSVVEADSAGYEYIDCVITRAGVPLVGCATLRVSLDLTEVQIEDTGERAERFEKNEEYFYLESGYVPLAVPRERYNQRNSWVFGGRKYLKVGVRDWPFFKAGELDVVVVLKNAELNIPVGNPLNSLEVMDNLLMSFWYSQKLGVMAIGFPGDKASSGSVYYCSKPVCLFADSAHSAAGSDK